MIDTADQLPLGLGSEEETACAAASVSVTFGTMKFPAGFSIAADGRPPSSE